MNSRARRVVALLSGLGIMHGTVLDTSAGPRLPVPGPRPAIVEPEELPITRIGIPDEILPVESRVPSAIERKMPEEGTGIGADLTGTPNPLPLLIKPLLPAPERIEPVREVQKQPLLPVDPLIIPPPPVPRGSAWYYTAELDFIAWRHRSQSFPSLVTTGSTGDAIPGALGQPGTQVLFGGAGAKDLVNGARARVAGDLGRTGFGFELGGFYTPPEDSSTTYSSASIPVLARPFFDTVPNADAAFLLAAPGVFTGAVTVATQSTLWGLEANASAVLDDEGAGIGFVGMRYLRLDDELQISNQFGVGNAGVAFINGVPLGPRSSVAMTDRVSTRNEFCGGQLGARYRTMCGSFGFEVRGALGVGVTHQRVEIDGSTSTVDAAGTTRGSAAGLLAQPSVSCVFERDQVSVLPEVGVKVFYQVAPCLVLQAGYDVLYWSSVARAGSQLDPTIDTRQSPTSANFVGAVGSSPQPMIHDTDFWAHGFNVGVRLEY